MPKDNILFFPQQSRTMKAQRAINYGIIIVSLLVFFSLLHNEAGQSKHNDAVEGDVPSYIGSNGSYKGTPWKNERTKSVKTVAETKFARCDVHTVVSEDGKNEVNDWVFMEEMDAVNVLVHDQRNNAFAVFKQGKYAIPGETYSPVGGFVNDGEAPWESARREVVEELGLGSQKTFDDMTSVEFFITYLVLVWHPTGQIPEL